MVKATTLGGQDVVILDAAGPAWANKTGRPRCLEIWLLLGRKVPEGSMLRVECPAWTFAAIVVEVDQHGWHRCRSHGTMTCRPFCYGLSGEEVKPDIEVVQVP